MTNTVMIITMLLLFCFLVVILNIVLKLQRKFEIEQLEVLDKLQETLKHLKELNEHNKDIINFNKELVNILMNDINFITANIKIIKKKIEKL